MHTITRFILLSPIILNTFGIKALPVVGKKIEPCAQKVADLLFKRECGEKKEFLINWHKGEKHPSLGVGHFIWNPQGSTTGFVHQFPALIAYLEKEGEAIPKFLQEHREHCPWKDRNELLACVHSSEIIELRDFLYRTRIKQAQFVINNALHQLKYVTNWVDKSERARVQWSIDMLCQIPQGLYALIDYGHFKGLGINPQEVYKGKGWGIKQVLLEMKPVATPQESLQEFIRAALVVIQERVKQAAHEQRFLEGWQARIKSYQYITI